MRKYVTVFKDENILHICNKVLFIDQVESLSSENEQLVTREQSLVRHISELEKQLQQQQQQNQKRRDSSPKLLQQGSPLLQELEAKLALTETREQAVAEKLDSQVLANIKQIS
jgi:ribosome-binding ATPase YchF (GTP1/OBG family)